MKYLLDAVLHNDLMNSVIAQCLTAIQTEAVQSVRYNTYLSHDTYNTSSLQVKEETTDVFIFPSQ